MTVSQILRLIDEIAPFESQEEWDNSGLLVGSPEQEVHGILFALDITEAVLDEAMETGTDLIITHHPLMFSARKRLTDEDYEGRLLQRMIRNQISHIAAHTNLDKAPDGMNDTLAACCGLKNVTGEGCFRAGDLEEPMPASEYADRLRSVLGDTVRRMGPESTMIHRVGLCSGGGSEFWEYAAAEGCDAFLSGEIRHHHALAMADAGIIGFECGHAATEVPGLIVLADALQTAMDTVQCNLRIFMSAREMYSMPCSPGQADFLSEGGS